MTPTQAQGKSETSLHYRLTNSEWLRAIRELKPRERDILYYLRTLDPFGDKELEIAIRPVARAIGCSPSTVSTALKALEKKGWIDLEIASAKVRLKSNHEDCSLERTPIAGANTSAQSDRSSDPRIAGAISDRSSEHPETIDSGRIDEFSTGIQNVPKQTKQTCLKNRSGATPTPAIIDEDYLDIFQVIPKRAGVPLNPALASVLGKLQTTYPEEAYDRVCNAISAYVEQRETVRNPQAFISAALRRGFTSNTAKKKTTAKQKQTREKTNVPPPSTGTDLSAAIALVDVHCRRLGLTKQEALHRCGFNKAMASLSPYEIDQLQDALARL